MKHIKLFSTSAEYEAFIAGDQFVTPNISFISTENLAKYSSMPTNTIFSNGDITLKTSELIVIFDSDGNGGIGDSDTFAYAIKENSCKQFDLGIDAYGADLKSNMPNDMIYIDDIYGIENSTEYKLIINDDESMYVYKNGNQVCEFNKDSKYFNIEFNSSFYKK